MSLKSRQRREKKRRVGVGPNDIWTEMVADSAGLVWTGNTTAIPIEELHAAYIETLGDRVGPIINGRFKVCVDMNLIKAASEVARAEEREAAVDINRFIIHRDEELVSGRSAVRVERDLARGVSIGSHGTIGS